MDWTLERINVPKNFFVLNRNEQTFPCGRKPDNKIVCPSLVVSRHHCQFLRTDDVISVIDLGSSNGIFINGQLSEPHIQVELRENDIIGIGSIDEYRDNEPMFIFKLHKGNLNSRNLEEFDDLLTQTSSIEIPNLPDVISVPISKKRAGKLKRTLPDEIKDEEKSVIPQKISKLGNGINTKSANDGDVHTAGIEPSECKKISPEIEEEIEEIWSTFGKQEISEPKTNRANGISDVTGKSTHDSNGSTRLTLNIDCEKDTEFKKPYRDVESMHRETELKLKGTAHLNSKNENELQSRNKQHRRISNDNTEIPEHQIAPAAQKPENLCSRPENSHKTIKVSIDSSASATTFTVNISEQMETDPKAKKNKEFHSPSNSKEGQKYDKVKRKSEDVSNRRIEQSEKCSKSLTTKANGMTSKIQSKISFSSKNLGATSAPGELKFTKQEPMTSFSTCDTVDLSDDGEDIVPSSQLFSPTKKGTSMETENDIPCPKAINLFKEKNEQPEKRSESMTTKANGMTNKIQPKLSSSNKAATSSPVKLKLVKQEPMTSFSIYDTVDLSDDDEDIFPSSQLFDSINEDTSVKVENNSLRTKAIDLFEDQNENEEYEEEDNKNFFTDRVIEDSKKIITLSDSEDDENPWLHRLSESQRIKEEEPEKNERSIEEMEFVDELVELKEDFVDNEKSEKEIQAFDELLEPKQNFIGNEKTGKEVQASKVEKHHDKSSKKSEHKSIVKHSRSMTVSEIERDVNNEEDENDDDDFDFGIFKTSSRLPILKETNEGKDVSTRIKPPGISKGPKLIEALHLPQRKHLRSKDFALPNDSDTLDAPSTSNDQVNIKTCSVRVSKLPSHLTLKQKRALQLEDIAKQKKYQHEQKIRRMKNAWAQSVPFPLGNQKRKSPVISKKEKLKIIEERKEKLKALAVKEKSRATKPSVERIAAKAKAKVSAKNRGDFLINEQVPRNMKTTEVTDEPSASKKESESSKAKLKSPKKINKSTTVKKTSEVPKVARKDKDESETKKDKKGKDESEIKKDTKGKDKSEPKKDKERSEKRSESIEKNSVATTSSAENNQIVEGLKKMTLIQKENQVPNSINEKEEEKPKSGPEREGKKKKRVSFSQNLFTIREFQIEPNHTMKKCTGKDALIPKDKIARAGKRADIDQQPKLEEFLLHIFQWNPSWLEEQKHLKTEPPVVDNESLIPLLTNYDSYTRYYQVLMPLLLLELWHGITKEFENIDRNNRRQTIFCSIVQNSVSFHPIPSTHKQLTTMLLEVLASEDDIKRQLHPVYGDLVFLELCYRNENGKQKFLKVFAYVTHFHRTNITPHTVFNRDLMTYTKNPAGVLTYTILTRPLKVEVCINRVLRLRCVTYLRSNMRMVQALQFLPKSPLLDLVINPRIEQFQLPYPTKQQSFLVTKDKLNHMQTEAVFKSTEAIVKKQPNICLIQGPPGTGKSEVIVNIVMQVLYGDNRYRSKDARLRILLCAPSNAAIDEIVLRLLDRRAKLINDRFKMVRVGLLGTMHPRVREISVEELAKRDVKRTTSSYQSCGQSMNSMEQEKRYLEARINALQSKLNSTQLNDENEIKNTNIKLMEMRTKYDLMNTVMQSTANNIDAQDLGKLQRGAENTILIGADIIACTLSSCYTNIMESAFGGNQRNISVCIVDEATQSCEADTLIPLMLGVNTLVLVGDPAQLPATVISQRAKILGLDQSMFSRIQKVFHGRKNNPVIMLDVQYRMDPHISYWPNNYFYSGRLKNGTARIQPVLPFHPYRVVNLDSSQGSDKFSNNQEAEFVANLIYGMINHMDAKKLTNSVSIGVITPYRNQQTLIKAKINQRILPILDNIKMKITTEVNTVDSFQGHERDIVIMSCVRTNGIGFLSDRQRLCVALTRAKHCLILCGNFGTFQRDGMWRALLSDAHSRSSFIEMKSDSKSDEIISQLIR